MLLNFNSFVAGICLSGAAYSYILLEKKTSSYALLLLFVLNVGMVAWSYK